MSLFFDYVKKEAKVDNLKKKPCVCYYGTDLERIEHANASGMSSLWQEDLLKQ